MSTLNEEVKIYNRFALDLAHGADVVDRKSYEVIIDSRRKKLLKRWLGGKNGLFLDYGCGDGSFSRFIKEKLETDVVGVDVSRGMVRYASAKGRGANHLIADCHVLPFKNESFDVVVALGVFHHLDLRKAMFECSRILKKGGLLMTFEPNSLCLLSFVGRRLLKTKAHTPNEKTYTHWQFINELQKNGFKITDLRFLSVIGFIFPFIWASRFSFLFIFLKSYSKHIQKLDIILEKILITKYLCWQFCCKCEF